MTAKLTLLNRRMVVEAEGADAKSLFSELGMLAEILEADASCGSCGSAEIRPGCRVIDQFEYFFLHCSACGAELSFGQRREGGLFPKRKTETESHSPRAAGNTTPNAPSKPRRNPISSRRRQPAAAHTTFEKS
jgi:hypothetical protein